MVVAASLMSRPIVAGFLCVGWWGGPKFAWGGGVVG